MIASTAERGSDTIQQLDATATPEARAATLGLLEAKLSMPRTHSRAVPRSALLRQLRSAGDRRTVTILAPPGYGKTSLLVQWAARDTREVAWLTADGGDNDPVVFLSYLAAAIDVIEPVGPDIFAAIGSPSVPSRAIVGRLLTVIQRRAEPVLVVIDDGHRITDQICLDALAEFITYMPAGSQVAIAMREPIGLPFARWRADGSMLEISVDDLAMSKQEAAAMGLQLGVVLTPGHAARLTRQTDGWPALLALATLEAARSDGLDRDIDPSRSRFIADYLRSELLEGRPEAEIAFLTRTSVLERLSGPICDAVLGQTGSTELLARLARSTILVDEYGGSYRYHALLRDFLQGELAAREPGSVVALHRRAAGWSEAHDALDLAIDHAFAADDLDLAATLAGRGMSVYHWSGRRATTRAWFRRFGDDALKERPWLAVLAAWEELGAGDVAATEHLADIAERGTYEGAPPDGTASFESGRAMLRAAMFQRGAEDALANAERAVALEVAGSPWRDFALWMSAIASITVGDVQAADAALAEAIAAARSQRNVGLLHCLLGHAALMAVDRRDWSVAAAFAKESDEIADLVNIEGYLSSAPARAAHIRISVQRGDITRARQDLARSMSVRPLLTAAAPGLAVQSLIAFAHAHIALGDPAGARTLLSQAGQVIYQRPGLGVLPVELAALRTTIAEMPFGVAGPSSLTAAEIRVLGLLPYYLSFKEIAQRLGVKATTVKTHALSIYGKLGVSTRGEAVEVAVEVGLLERFPT